MTPEQQRQSVLDQIREFERQGRYDAADRVRAQYGIPVPGAQPATAPEPQVLGETELFMEEVGESQPDELPTLPPVFGPELAPIGDARLGETPLGPGDQPFRAPERRVAPAPAVTSGGERAFLQDSREVFGPQRGLVRPSGVTEFVEPAFLPSEPATTGFAQRQQLVDQISRQSQSRKNELISMGFSVPEAEQVVAKETRDVLARRFNVEGEPTSSGFGGLGDLLETAIEYTPLGISPFYRESRVDFSKQPFMYREDDGTTRPATQLEIARESTARQTVLTPEEAANRRKVRSIEREAAAANMPGALLWLPDYEDDVRMKLADRETQVFERVFETVDPETGRVIETPLAAAMRNTGIISTVINEAALSLPLFYDINDQGQPTNPEQFAYKAHKFLVDRAVDLGMDRKDAERALSGRVGGMTPYAGGLLIPVPFQGINRAGATPADPTAFRGVSETESFLGDVALSLAKGRFLGDELMSMPGLVQDMTEMSFKNNELESGKALETGTSNATIAAQYYPMLYGAGLEMFYGFPLVGTLAKGASLAGRGVKLAGAAAKAKAAASVAQGGKGARVTAALQAIESGAAAAEKVGAFIEAPVEVSKRVKQTRAIQDLMDGAPDKPDIDLLMDASTARRVVSDTLSKDILTPYIITQRALSQGGLPTHGQLRGLAGDSLAGRQFLDDLGVTPATADNELVSPSKLREAFLDFRVAVNRSQIESIARDPNLTDSDKAARIFALLSDPISMGTSRVVNAEEYFATSLLNDTPVGADEVLRDLALIATGGNLDALKRAERTARELAADTQRALDAETAALRAAEQVRAAERAANRQQPALFRDPEIVRRIEELTAKANEQRILADELADMLVNAEGQVQRLKDLDVPTVANGLLSRTSGKVYPPVRAGQPVIQSVHDFGLTLADNARVQGRAAQRPRSTKQGALLEAFAPGKAAQEFRPLRGPLADSYLRRTGGLLPHQTVLDPAKSEIYREAAIGTGSRAIASTLENVVPDDLVFVTNTLMVPRQKVTPQVLARVRQEYETFGPLTKFNPVEGPKVNGRTTVLYEYQPPVGDALRPLGGAEAVARSPMRNSILEEFSKAEQAGTPARLSPAQHEALQDILLTDAYGRVFKDEAVDAVFSGAQTEQARIPTVGLGLLSTGAEQMPRQSRALAEARQPSVLSLPFQAAEVGLNLTGPQVGSLLRRASQKYNSQFLGKLSDSVLGPELVQQTPDVFERTKRTIESAVSSIPDNFQREVRDAAATMPPEAAFNEVLKRRISREAQRVAELVDARKQTLVQMGLEPEEAYSLIAFQTRTGTRQTGVGAEIAQTGVIADARAQALKAATEEATESNWGTILKSFFGPDVYFRTLAPDGNINALYPYIKRTITNEDGQKIEVYRPISTGDLREAIRLIREDNSTLKGRGLQRERLPGGAIVGATEDAVFDTLASWAMGRDRALIIDQQVSRMFDEHPWMVTDLAPRYGMANVARAQTEADAVANARGYVLGALDAVGQAKKSSTAELQGRSGLRALRFHLIRSGGRDRRAFTGRSLTGAPAAEVPQRRIPGTPFQVAGQPFTPVRGQLPPIEGSLTRELDELTVRSYRNLTPQTRGQLVKFIYSKMLEEGTQSPNLTTMVAETFDDPQLNLLFFQKQATSEALLSLVREFDRRFAQSGPFTDPQDRILYAAINDARDAVRAGQTGAEANAKANRAVVTAMRRALLQNALESFVLPAAAEMQANLRAAGWTPDAAQARRDIGILVDSMNPMDPRFATAGQDFVKAVESLKAASRDGRLADTLDELQRADKLKRAFAGEGGEAVKGSAALEYVLSSLLDSVRISRVAAASSLLAGGYYITFPDDDIPVPVPAPNTRYLGVNLLTAPLIAATTLGTMGAIRLLPGVPEFSGRQAQMLEAGRQVLPDFLRRPLVDTVTPGAESDILFTTSAGRRWTRAEFQDAIERNSINITRGGAEFFDQYARELARDARLTAEGVQAAPLRQYLLRNIDPTRTGAFQYVANATDRAFRQNVFASALKSGMTEDQAAQLSRAVMLDYGKSTVTRPASKYIMFLAFREAMMREVIEAAARDPEALNRTILLHDRLAKQMDDELRSDHSRLRLPFPKTFVFDNTAASKVYGPVNPGLSAYADMAQFAAWVLQTGAKNVPDGTLARAISEQQLHPVINYIADSANLGRRGPQGGKVPDEWVAYSIENSPEGLWPMLKERYNIVPVLDPSDRTPGRLRAVDPATPALGPLEYRFKTTADERLFLRDLEVMQVLGFTRTLRDYTNAGIAYGVEDYLVPNRRGLPTTLGFLSGFETPMTMRSPEELVRRAIREQEQALRATQPAE